MMMMIKKKTFFLTEWIMNGELSTMGNANLTFVILTKLFL